MSAAARRALVARVGEIRSKKDAVVSHIDSLFLRLPHWLSCGAFDALAAQCRDLNRDRSGGCYHVHGPSATAIEMLAETYGDRCKIRRIDIACDLITKTHEDAKFLKRELDVLLTLSWRGKSLSNSFGKTTYLAQSEKHRNVTIYADRNCKVTGTPCCHVEFRYSSPELLRRRGIVSLNDIPKINLDEWLKRDARLSLIDWEIADKKVSKLARDAVAKSHKPIEVEITKIQHMICMLAHRNSFSAMPQWRDSTVSTQVWLDSKHPIIRDSAIHTPFIDLLA